MDDVIQLVKQAFGRLGEPVKVLRLSIVLLLISCASTTNDPVSSKANDSDVASVRADVTPPPVRAEDRAPSFKTFPEFPNKLMPNDERSSLSLAKKDYIATPERLVENKTEIEAVPAVEALSHEALSAVAENEAEQALSRPAIPEGIFVGERAAAQENRHDVETPAETGEEGITLNFVNADIRDVAKSVLGDMLGLNYVISPTVKGTVTIKTNRAIPRDAIIPALNSAFRFGGAAIVQTPNAVKVVPSTEALRHGVPVASAEGKAERGFGLQVVALRFISAEEMKRVLEPIAPAGGVVPLDVSRNILLLTGTEDERAAMIDVVETFDVDWLSGMSFGLFPLKEANAKVVANELWGILGEQTGPLAKLVKIVVLDRLNAVLAISPQPRYLKEIKKWIDRLDYDKAPADQRIWVYQVQYGRAQALSETLEKLLSGHKGRVSYVEEKGGIDTTSPPPLSVDPAGDVLGSSFASSDGPKVIADESTNSLIIMATKSDYSLIESALLKLDIVPLQVRIEAVIAEVTLTDDLRYGVQYLFKQKDVSAVLTLAQTLDVNPTLPGFSAFVSGSKISAVLDLLQSKTNVNVISSPQLMVVNNQTALLQIGDQVPVATQQAVSVLTPGAPVVNSIQLRDTGVILKVTPRVNSSGMVNLDISQEVSDVARTTTSTLDSPTIQQRKISSTVAVRDGETIALGGLIKDNVSSGRSGIPFLQDIPLLGSLFSTTTETGNRTELLALITPRVVYNDHDVRAVTEEMRQQIHAVAPLTTKVH